MHNTVNNGWDTERSCFAVWFWDFHTSYGARTVHFESLLNKRDELFFTEAANILYRSSVYACGFTASVAFDSPICQFDVFCIFHQTDKVTKHLAFLTVSI